MEFGELHQGKRNDLDRARADARDNGMRSVVNWANYQGIRTAEKYLEYNSVARDADDAVTVHVLYGGTGSGKSRDVRDLTKCDDVYNHPCDGQRWWPGYDGQLVIIMDDMRGSCFPFNYLLKILDRGPVRCEVKGGYRQLRGLTFYITSNNHPSQWYPNLETERVDQLLRRITTITHYSLPFGQNVPPALGVLTEAVASVVQGNNMDLVIQPELHRQNAGFWTGTIWDENDPMMVTTAWPPTEGPEQEDAMRLHSEEIQLLKQ